MDVESQRMGGRVLLPSIANLVVGGKRDVSVEERSLEGEVDGKRRRGSVGRSVKVERCMVKGEDEGEEDTESGGGMTGKDRARRREKNREYGRRFRESQKQKMHELANKIITKQKEIDRAKERIVEQERYLRLHGLKTDLTLVEDLDLLEGDLDMTPKVLQVEAKTKSEGGDQVDPYQIAENSMLSHFLCRQGEIYDSAEVLLCLFTLSLDGSIKSARVMGKVGYDSDRMYPGRQIWDDLHPHDRSGLQIVISHCVKDKRSASQVLRCAYRRQLRNRDKGNNPSHHCSPIVRVYACIQTVFNAAGSADGLILAEFLEA